MTGTQIIEERLGLFTSLLLMLAVNIAVAKPTIEERQDDLLYLEGGLGIDSVLGGNINDLGYTALGGAVRLGARITPTLAAELNLGTSHEFLGSGSTERATVGVNWMPIPNLALSGGIGARWLHANDAGGIGEAIGTVLGTAAGQIVCVALSGEPCDLPIENVITSTDTVDLGLEVAVLSQWQWSRFVLSVEWASVYQPIAILDQQQTFRKGDASVEIDPKMTVLDLPINVRIATVSVGASF